MSDVERLAKHLTAFQPDPETGLLQPRETETPLEEDVSVSDPFGIRGVHRNEIFQAFGHAEILRNINDRIGEYTTLLNQEADDVATRQEKLDEVLSSLHDAQLAIEYLSQGTPTVAKEDANYQAIHRFELAIDHGLESIFYPHMYTQTNIPLTSSRNHADWGRYLSNKTGVQTLFALGQRKTEPESKTYGGKEGHVVNIFFDTLTKPRGIDVLKAVSGAAPTLPSPMARAAADWIGLATHVHIAWAVEATPEEKQSKERYVADFTSEAIEAHKRLAAVAPDAPPLLHRRFFDNATKLLMNINVDTNLVEFISINSAIEYSLGTASAHDLVDIFTAVSEQKDRLPLHDGPAGGALIRTLTDLIDRAHTVSRDTHASLIERDMARETAVQTTRFLRDLSRELHTLTDGMVGSPNKDNLIFRMRQIDDTLSFSVIDKCRSTEEAVQQYRVLATAEGEDTPEKLNERQAALTRAFNYAIDLHKTAVKLSGGEITERHPEYVWVKWMEDQITASLGQLTGLGQTIPFEQAGRFDRASKIDFGEYFASDEERVIDLFCLLDRRTDEGIAHTQIRDITGVVRLLMWNALDSDQGTRIAGALHRDPARHLPLSDKGTKEAMKLLQDVSGSKLSWATDEREERRKPYSTASFVKEAKYSYYYLQITQGNQTPEPMLDGEMFAYAAKALKYLDPREHAAAIFDLIEVMETNLTTTDTRSLEILIIELVDHHDRLPLIVHSNSMTAGGLSLFLHHITEESMRRLQTKGVERTERARLRNIGETATLLIISTAADLTDAYQNMAAAERPAGLEDNAQYAIDLEHARAGMRLFDATIADTKGAFREFLIHKPLIIDVSTRYPETMRKKFDFVLQMALDDRETPLTLRDKIVEARQEARLVTNLMTDENISWTQATKKARKLLRKTA